MWHTTGAQPAHRKDLFIDIVEAVYIDNEPLWEQGGAIAVVLAWGPRGPARRRAPLHLGAARALAVGASREPGGMDGSPLAFRSEPKPAADVEIRANFGMFAGREATRAEVDDLARELLGVVSQRDRRGPPPSRAVDREGEAVVHQVRIETSEADAHAAGGDRRPLADRVLEVVDGWARRCIEQRHAETAGARSAAVAGSHPPPADTE